MRYSLQSLYLLAAFILLLCIFQHLPTVRGKIPTKTRDVYYIYTDAALLAAGENPYQRIAGKGLKHNEKYTFYLPGFLWGAAASIRYLGHDSYTEWMQWWIATSFAVHVLIGLILFVYCNRRWGLVPGVLGSAFWWFTRWPLALLRSGQIDNIAILFFVIALTSLQRHHRLSLVMLGTSLAIKQMAALTVPLFILWPPLRHIGREQLKALARQWGMLVIIPLALSLPFLLWDPVSFLHMLIFPLTRDPSGPRSLESFIGVHSLLGKIPFLALVGICYVYFVQRAPQTFAPVLFLLLLFLGFNPVFFSRYFCWAIPIIPLAIFESIETRLHYTPTSTKPKILMKRLR